MVLGGCVLLSSVVVCLVFQREANRLRVEVKLLKREREAKQQRQKTHHGDGPVKQPRSSSLNYRTAA